MKSTRLKRKALLEYTGAGGNFFRYTNDSVKLMMQTIGFKNVKILNESIKIFSNTII